MRAAGLGAMHWYDNNWHYVRRWEHLRGGATLSRWPEEVRRALSGLARRAFPASDAVMSRAISTPVSLAWSEAETTARAEKLAAAVRGALGT